MDKQNIILVSWDSVRADHLETYGYERDTAPFLDELADDGLVFEDAYVSGVGTPTSFTGAFTGEHAHGVQANIAPEHWRESNADRRLLSEAMRDAGYYTGAVHANALMSRHYGWDRGWDVFRDNMWTEAGDTDTARRWNAVKKTAIQPALRRLGVAGEAIHAKNIALKQKSYEPWEPLWEHVERFVADAPEPWFLWVLLVDTHHPWFAPREHREWGQPGFRRTHALNYVMRRWPGVVGERNESIVNAYDNELRHADAFLERLSFELESRGMDPALVFHSDHGDELGEHDDYGHAPAMWDTVTRVPLVMHNVGETGRVEGPHTLLDLGSTVLDIAGSDERLAGRPSLLGNEREDRDAVYIENRELDDTRLSAIATREWKVTLDETGAPVGYRRDEDPLEQEPRGPPHRLVNKFIDMRERAKAADDPDGAYDGPSPEVAERLGELGYL